MRSDSKGKATGIFILGRIGGAMTQSQENCLSDNHRLTCERRGGDYDGKSIAIGYFQIVLFKDTENSAGKIGFFCDQLLRQQAG